MGLSFGSVPSLSPFSKIISGHFGNGCVGLCGEIIKVLPHLVTDVIAQQLRRDQDEIEYQSLSLRRKCGHCNCKFVRVIPVLEMFEQRNCLA